MPALIQEHLSLARDASGGRSAHTVYGGHARTFRQTLIALNRASASTNMRIPAKRPCTYCTAGSA